MNVEVGAKTSLVFTVQRPTPLGGYVGVTGLSPVVAVRRANVLGGWLDWFDMTFKTAGWTSRQTLMSEVSATLAPGHYERVLDTALPPGMVAGFPFYAEFFVDNGLDVRGIASEAYVMTTEAADAALILESVHNPMTETPGVPFGTLVLFKSDGVTPRITWQVRDYQGNATVGESGIPARRTAGVVTP